MNIPPEYLAIAVGGALFLALFTLIGLRHCAIKVTMGNLGSAAGWWLAGVFTCLLSAVGVWTIGWGYKPADTGMGSWWVLSALWLVASLAYMYGAIAKTPTR